MRERWRGMRERESNERERGGRRMRGRGMREREGRRMREREGEE